LIHFCYLLKDKIENNGRIGVTPEFPEGIYYYMVTDEFPFFSRCLKGRVLAISIWLLGMIAL
jgi:hypothetical protein